MGKLIIKAEDSIPDSVAIQLVARVVESSPDTEAQYHCTTFGKPTKYVVDVNMTKSGTHVFSVMRYRAYESTMGNQQPPQVTL